uniref:Uncharacterized protein n=1 Tax=Percolomonas cosmopolitus TaxID=63605 RepID=A0A7S1KUS3_9EUKA|mmetsp:Transcript_9887/g.36857  ORF Transcript_9887/g.36857 Transcript_9887/m.36857 type:complete len:340 (+) Transcript_9887:725-1744(+)
MLKNVKFSLDCTSMAFQCKNRKKKMYVQNHVFPSDKRTSARTRVAKDQPSPMAQFRAYFSTENNVEPPKELFVGIVSHEDDVEETYRVTDLRVYKRPERGKKASEPVALKVSRFSESGGVVRHVAANVQTFQFGYAYGKGSRVSLGLFQRAAVGSHYDRVSNLLGNMTFVGTHTGFSSYLSEQCLSKMKPLTKEEYHAKKEGNEKQKSKKGKVTKRKARHDGGGDVVPELAREIKRRKIATPFEDPEPLLDSSIADRNRVSATPTNTARILKFEGCDNESIDFVNDFIQDRTDKQHVHDYQEADDHQDDDPFPLLLEDFEDDITLALTTLDHAHYSVWN